MCLQDEIENLIKRPLNEKESTQLDDLAVFVDNDSGRELTAKQAIITLELK